MTPRPVQRFGWMLITMTALCGFSGAALANPTGGSVSAGSASISSSGTTLTVTQSSSKAVIDWRGFNITQNETTDFVQPSSSSIALNRVNDINPSIIAGQLDANGHIMVINPNGVIFTKTAQIDVAGITATTANIADSDFMAGNYNFSQPGSPTGAIINQGSITVEQAGLASLVAPIVENDGVITAKLGKINLASGDAFTLDLAGDGKVQVAVSGNHLPVQAAINNGTLSAGGGAVTITAAAASDLVNDLIVNTGVIQANAMNGAPGSVTLYAEGSNAGQNNVAANKGQTPGTSTVINSGIIDASGYGSGQTGGSISILADNVGIMSGSFIDASGDAGGGTIRIGGDFHGAGTTPTAINTYVDANALIMANANTSGNGGSVAVWSDGDTWFSGSILAEGGKNSGNGGFVETSGHGYLDANGYVDLMALNGQKGTYLLDPANIYVYGNFTPAYAETIAGDSSTLASNLQLWLDASDTSNVTLTYNSTGTTATGSSGGNTITVGSSTGLQVGERVQLGGSSDSFAASVNDNSSDGIYTISAISGTTVTLDANLSSSYSGVTLYGGFASQLTDKSGTGNNATQVTAADMPLWISNGQNGLGVSYFTGPQFLIGSDAKLPVGDKTLFSTVYDSNVNFSNGTYNGAFWYGKPLTNNESVSLGFGTDGNMGANAFDVSQWGNALGIQNSLQQWLIGSATNTGNSWALSTNGGSGTSKSMATATTVGGSYGVGAYCGSGCGASMNGYIGDVAIYGSVLSVNAQALINQYQSAKWGIALTGPGNVIGESGLTGTEAQEAMASTQAGATTDGYSVFTTGYLNHLSQSSNIILDAGNNITLDFQGDTLSLATGKSLSLTAGNQITTASTGTITTAGGAINLNATNGIDFANAFTLNSGGGNINFNNVVTLGAAVAVNSGGGAVTFASTVDGANNLTVNSGNAGSATFTGQVGSNTGLGAFSVTAGNGITLNAVTASSINLDSSGGSGAIASNNSGILDATSGTITVNSGGDIDFSNIAQETSNQAVSDTAVGNAYLNAINSGTGSLTVSANNVYLYGGGLPNPTNLVGYWNFNEGSGTTAIDDSGNGNTGTINGATYSSTVPGAISPDSNSLSFNGASSYINAGSGASLNITGSAITLTAWIDPTGATAFKQIIARAAGTGSTQRQYGLYVVGSGAQGAVNSLGFNLNAGSTTIDLGKGTLTNGVWQQIAGVYDGSNMYWYINGQQVGSQALTGSIASQSANVVLGEFATGGLSPFNGLIDDPRIYNTALSAQDVKNLYAGIPKWSVGTANITATGNITTDIMGTTLSAGAGKNITMTAGGSIVNSSAGTVSGSQSAGSGGNISLITNALNFAANPTISTNGTVTIEPDTASTTVGVAGGAGSLAITSGVLGDVTAGNIVIGNTSDSGLLTADAYTWGENVSLLSGTGGITIAGAQNVGSNTFFAETTGASDITLGASGSVTSTASNAAITLASGQNFINDNGSGALSASSGRWLVYSTNPSDDTDNGLSNSFRRFSCTYGGSCPSFPATGNGFLYGYTPTLTITPGSLSITYGDAAPNLTGYAYSVSGYLDSDSGSDSLSGSLTGNTNYTQYANHGSYNINYSSGSLASAMGYGFSYANNTGGLTVGTKGLTVTAANKSMDAGGSVPPLTYSYSGLAGGDASASFSGALATTGSSGSAAGNYPITIGTLAATGNYGIASFNAGLLTISTAAPAISTEDIARILQMPRIIIESQPMAEAPMEEFSEAAAGPSGLIALAPASPGVRGDTGGSSANRAHFGRRCDRTNADDGQDCDAD